MLALGEVCDVIIGRTPDRSRRDFWGQGFPWLSIADMSQGNVITETKEQITDSAVASAKPRLIQPGTVLLSFKLSIGKVGIANVPLYTNEAIAALPIKAGAGLDPQYLAWALRSADLAAGGDRAAMGRTLNKAKLLDLRIPLPPLGEQRRIAGILDAADALRAKRRESIALLDTLTQSIFLDMFGDPGRNPRGWPVSSIGDLLERAQYGTSAKAGAIGELPVLRMGNITSNGYIDFSDLKYLDLTKTERDKYLVRAGDVLFNRTNSPELVGKSAIFRSREEYAYAGYLIRLRTLPGNNPEYLAAFLNSSYAKRVLRSMCKSIIGMANINAREIQAVRIPVPPGALQDDFAERIQSIEDARVLQGVSLSGLGQLFASLQSRAFRREL